MAYRKEQGVVGEDGEVRCAKDLVARYGGKSTPSDNFTNRCRHIDLFYYNEKAKKNPISIDVKTANKIRRFSADVSYNYRWIETVNSNGGKGWVYGEEDYIAFEGPSDWQFYERKTLSDFVEERMKAVTTTPTLVPKGVDDPEILKYKWYKHNEFDTIVLIDLDDVKDKIAFTVPKTE